MYLYFLPLLLIICSNSFYHVCAKSIPGNVNQYASLFVTYLVAAGCTLILMFFNKGISKDFLSPFKGINWSSFVLGICIVGLEYGYMWAYRAGANISTCSLIANIALAAILLAVGLLLYKEPIHLNQWIGIGLCIAGLVFINKK